MRVSSSAVSEDRRDDSDRMKLKDSLCLFFVVLVSYNIVEPVLKIYNENEGINSAISQSNGNRESGPVHPLLR